MSEINLNRRVNYNVYRPPKDYISQFNGRIDFLRMIENIRESPIYDVIKNGIEQYEQIVGEAKFIKTLEGTIFCQINRPKYPKELNDLLLKYSDFYKKNGENKYITNKDIYKINQNVKIKRDYGIPNNPKSINNSIIKRLNTVEGLSNVLNERITGLGECMKKIEQNLEKNNDQKYFQLSNERLRELKSFYKEQKNKEKGIKNNYDMIILYIEQTFPGSEEEKKELIRIIKKKKNQLISESLLYNNTNKPFNPEECRLSITNFPNNLNIFFKQRANESEEKILQRKTEFLDKLKKIADKYIIPQGKKVIILGRLETMFKYKYCKGLFHGAMDITPFFQIKPGEELCSKYVVYSLFMNRLLLAFSFAQNMDIPAIYNSYLDSPDKVYKYVPKLKGESLERLKTKKFIGIIEIPYYHIIPENKRANGGRGNIKILYYKYIFVFESDRTDLYPHYGIVTHYELYNQNLETIVYGTTSLKTTITFDELDALYWMSKKFTNEFRIYFYRDKDPTLNTYIFISTKPDLDNKLKYPLYDLEKVYIEKWYEEYINRKIKTTKPLIKTNKQFMLINEEQEKKLINEVKLNKLDIPSNIINKIKRKEKGIENIPPRIIKIRSLNNINLNNYLVSTFREPNL